MLTGICTCVAAPIDPMAYVSGTVADAIGTTADLSAARRGRSREVSGAREHVCMCVRAATCAAIGAARMPPPLLRCCQGRALGSSATYPRLTRLVWRAVADLSAAAAPLSAWLNALYATFSSLRGWLSSS